MTCCPLKLLILPCFTGRSRAGTTAFDHLSTGLRKDYEVQCRATSGSFMFLFGWTTRFTGQVALKSTNELQIASESTRRNPLKSMPQSGAELWICVENAEIFTTTDAKNATPFMDFALLRDLGVLCG